LTEAAIRDQLARILASDLFVNARKLGGFLEFVVEQSLAGRQQQIKESVVGTEVYVREAGYDPRADAVVRVEATKLRAKLVEYYGGPGRSDEILIEVPKGSYVPRFTSRQPRAVSVPLPWIRILTGATVTLALGAAICATGRL
jgi:hypothetical protein